MAVLHPVEVRLISVCHIPTPFFKLTVQCPLDPMEHGSVTLSSLGIAPVIATYSCQNGYLLIGPKKRECVYSSSGDFGQWSGIIPACKFYGILCCNNCMHGNNH